MKRTCYVLLLLTFLLSTIISSSQAAWQGPIQVLSGVWGSGVGQFGFEAGDSGDDFPRSFGISASQRIIIADSINEVLHVFDNNGMFLRDINKPQEWSGWPSSVLVNGECAVVGYVQMTHTFDIATGNLLGKANNMGGAKYVNENCSSIYSGGKKKGWKIYTPTGQLLKTSSEMPLELGKVTTEPLGSARYKITISYPDKIYGLSADRAFVRFTRDIKGFIYGVNAGGAWRFNQCGNMIGAVLLPSAQITTIPSQGKGEPNVNVHEEYGEPVIAQNGDVYTWKRTPDKYFILKWTWVDDPNVPTGPDAPTGLTLMPSTTGIYLTWTASPGDPGCVTGYEISRATSAGGVATTVATVNAGVVKYNDSTGSAGTTYYYKIRAKAGSEYSNYTAEVSGKR